MVWFPKWLAPFLNLNHIAYSRCFPVFRVYLLIYSKNGETNPILHYSYWQGRLSTLLNLFRLFFYSYKMVAGMNKTNFNDSEYWNSKNEPGNSANFTTGQ